MFISSLLVLVLLLQTALAAPPQKRMLLSEVKALTLREGEMTAARRVSAVPQLTCVGGTAGCDSRYTPATVQCHNQGEDHHGETQWRCEAELDNSVRFGTINVNCEGYADPDDEYILAGSCGLQYSLDWTSTGYNSNRRGGYYDNYNSGSSNQQSLAGSLISLAIFGVVIFAFVRICCGGGAGPFGGMGGGWRGGWGGGPGGGGPGGYPSGGNTGFWPGFAAGGVGGYMASRFMSGSRSGSSFSSRSFGGSRSSGSSGTRTSSGFGGSSRR